MLDRLRPAWSEQRMMSGTPARRRSNPFSLPNMLTYGRLAAVPAIVAILFWPKDDAMRWWALGIYAVACVTDYLDGWIARTWSQQSSIGRMLDPIADKVLVAAVLLMLVADRTISSVSIWAAIIILSREILVSGLREYLAELRVSVPVTRVAKWKTTAQLVSIGFLVAGPAGDQLLPAGWTVMIGLVLLWLAALLTLYTGFDYFRAGITHLIDDDEGQR
jgi:cardiolipin synthase (CMP-forming)